MLIVCPSCATAYNVDVASLQPNGRQVRCVRCRTVWHAMPGRADKLAAAAAAIAPALHGVEEAFKSSAAELTPTAPSHRAAVDVESLADAAHGPPPADENGVAAGDASGAVEVAAPPIAPVDLDEGKPPIDVDADSSSAQGEEPHQDIEPPASRRRGRAPKRRSPRWPLSHLQNAIVALLIVDAVLIAWRNDIVRVLPQTASFYAMLGLSVNLRGLVFDGITTSTEMHDGVPILVVEGNIVNVTTGIVDVPRLKFAARNGNGEEVYSWTAVPPRTTLPPHEGVAFHTRFASPPPDVRNVLVRFVTRNDFISGAR
jgi:predicted Zn finger-like uncharacterized protein